MKKLCLIVMAIIIVLLCVACSKSTLQSIGNDVNDNLNNLRASDNKYVKMVKNGYNENYPDLTYDKAFSDFFGSPKWTYGKSEIDEIEVDIVEFNGECTYADVPVKARLQFVVDEENATFEAYSLTFNEVPQTYLIMYALLETVFEETEMKQDTPVITESQEIEELQNDVEVISNKPENDSSHSYTVSEWKEYLKNLLRNFPSIFDDSWYDDYYNRNILPVDTEDDSVPLYFDFLDLDNDGIPEVKIILGIPDTSLAYSNIYKLYGEKYEKIGSIYGWSNFYRNYKNELTVSERYDYYLYSVNLVEIKDKELILSDYTDSTGSTDYKGKKYSELNIDLDEEEKEYDLIIQTEKLQGIPSLDFSDVVDEIQFEFDEKAKSRTPNTPPINNLTKENIEDYIAFDVRFSDNITKGSDIIGFIIYKTKMEVSVYSLKNVEYDGVEIEIICKVEDWDTESIKLRISYDGKASASATIQYKTVFNFYSEPTLSSINIISVKGTVKER